MKTQFSGKEGNVSHEKKISDQFFSFYRVWQTLGDNLLGYMRLFDFIEEL